MKEQKKVILFGERVSVGQIKHWRWEAASDAPGISDENQCRFEAFLKVTEYYRTASYEGFFDLLHASSFRYTSDWVEGQIEGRDRFIGYFKEKCEAWRNHRTVLEVIPVCVDAALFPQTYAYALWIRQGENDTLLMFEFDRTRLSKLSMKDPDLYDFHPITTRLDTEKVVRQHELEAFLEGYLDHPLMDENGEPLSMDYPPNEAKKTGEELTEEEMFAFAVEVAGRLLKSAGYAILSVLRTTHDEYPQLVATLHGRKRYFYVRHCVAPQKSFTRIPGQLARQRDFALSRKTEARFFPIGFFSLSENQKCLSGGTFLLRLGPISRM